MKRLLSLMLAAMMLFALAVVPTTAAEATDEAATTEAITPDTSWYDSSKSEFEISNAEQLLGFVELANGGNTFAGKTISMTADIDLNPGTTLHLDKGGDGKYILPEKPVNVWKGMRYFNGHFNGNGHVLSGVYVEVDCNSAKAQASLFGNISEGSVKNLIVENSFALAKNITSDASVGSSAAGIAELLRYGATVESLWVDMDVVTLGWKGGETAGVVAEIGADNGKSAGTIRNVVFAGTVAALKPDLLDFNTSGAMAVSQILANQNWKMKTSLDNVAMLGTTLCKDGTNGKLPICLNAKMSEINLHAVYGKHASIDDATTAGAYWDYASTENTHLNTTADFTYSLFAGGVIPTAVSEMMAKMTARALRVVGVQRSQTPYTAGEGDNTYTAQSLRFVAGIRLLGVPLGDFETVGFLIQIDENGTKSHIKVDGTTVYTSIAANGETVTAEQENADYLVALSVQNVPIGEEFTLTITPYLIGKDGTKWTGEAVFATVLASGAYKNEVPTDASQNGN